MHVKDAVRDLDNSSKIHGSIACKGQVGWRKIIKTFQDNGYDSFYSLETHMSRNRWENSDESLKNLRLMVKNAEESIRKISEYAAQTRIKIKDLEALAPLLKFIERA